MNHAIIDKTKIQQRIEELETKILYAYKEPLNGNIHGIPEWVTEIKILKEINSTSIDLNPILDKAFSHGNNAPNRLLYPTLFNLANKEFILTIKLDL